MGELAAQLPDGLLDDIRLALLQATSHVDRFKAPATLEVRLFCRDAVSKTEYKIILKDVEWRSTK